MLSPASSVAARLVRLRFDSRADVLGCVILSPLACVQHHKGRRAELCSSVDIAQYLAQRKAATSTVVGCEPAVHEDGLAKQVGRDHRDHDLGIGERLLEAIGSVLADGPKAEREVIVTAGADHGCS